MLHLPLGAQKPIHLNYARNFSWRGPIWSVNALEDLRGVDGDGDDGGSGGSGGGGGGGGVVAAPTAAEATVRPKS